MAASCTELRSSITDSIITQSINGMPPEVVALSGAELIQKLIHRRNDLEKYAARYYAILAKHVRLTARLNGNILR